MAEQPQPLKIPEPESKKSLAEVIETRQGSLSIVEVETLLEKGIHNLPKIEGGGKLHGSSEAKNKQLRIEYLENNLNLKASEIPHPSLEGKQLPERLVSDVLVDTISLCQTADSLLQIINRQTDKQKISDAENREKTQARQALQLNLSIYNSQMNLRRLKGKSLETDLSIENQATTVRKHGQEHGFFPARSLNLIRPGYVQAIFSRFEQALERIPQK